MTDSLLKAAADRFVRFIDPVRTWRRQKNDHYIGGVKLGIASA
jgi:hypothetical protein